MPSFGKTSKARLETAHPRLIEVFEEVVKHFDCSILQGHRGKVEQNDFFHRGLSKVQWPNGKHNSVPSLAVDAAPYPIDWNDRARFSYFAGFVVGIAASKGIKIRWGGDWDGDRELADEKGLSDLPHFELVG